MVIRIVGLTFLSLTMHIYDHVIHSFRQLGAFLSIHQRNCKTSKVALATVYNSRKKSCCQHYSPFRILNICGTLKIKIVQQKAYYFQMKAAVPVRLDRFTCMDNGTDKSMQARALLLFTIKACNCLQRKGIQI